MRTLISITLVLIAALAAALGAAAQYDDEPAPAHLVLSVEGDIENAVFNRLEWGVTDFAPLLPATSLRSNDYFELPPDTTIVILCADLTLSEQRSAGVPDCPERPVDPAFFYPGDPAWLPDEGPATVTIADTSPAPDDINAPGQYDLVPLEGDKQALITERVAVIDALPVADDVKAFALSSLYREAGVTFDAVNVLLGLEGLGCQRAGQPVQPPSGTERPLVKSPVLYLRLGELYQMLDQLEIAARYYGCAQGLAEALNDPANIALAAARRANTADIADAIPFYQMAIDNYALIGATDYTETMASFCGRDCTLPE
jgi:hypothetical protein